MSALFELHEEYRDYNKVVVTLITDGNKETVISKVNLKGRPEKDCGANLISLNIEPPAFDSGDASNCGAKGTVTVVDYKDSVFNTLSSHFTNFLAGTFHINEGEDLQKVLSDTSSPQIKQAELLPKIRIEIYCYIGPKKTYEGHITDWSTQFVGTTPQINLNWSVICPTDVPKGEVKATFTGDPIAYFSSIKENYDADDTARPHNIKFDPGTGAIDVPSIETLSTLLTITNSETVTQPSSCGNKIIDALQLISSMASYNDKPVGGVLSEDGNTYIFIVKDPYNNSPSNALKNISNNVLFIQNGKYAAYSKYPVTGQTVVPMTSFSFDTSFKKLALQYSIIENPNGNQLTVDGEQSTDGDATQAANQLASLSKDSDQGAIQIKFDCYNTMAFDQYNLSSEINFLVFNEFGEKHVTSGKAIVTKVSYELSGAVVKASVEATQVFNSIIGSETNSTNKSIGEIQFPMPTKPNVALGNSSNPSNKPTKSGNPTKPSKNPELVEYLCTEDEDPIKLEADKTSKCINDGTFVKHVTKFLNKYGDLTGTQKLLDGDFVQELMDDGDFGLLALLIGAGNYGIKNYDEYKSGESAWASIKDPVNLYKGLDKTKFCASDGGKNPYDYKTGGLGMPHWDAENLKNIYQTHGFDKNLSSADKEHFSSLLLGLPDNPQEAKKYTGTISEWYTAKCSLDNNIIRVFPKFDGKVYMRRFDKGLKQDSKWLEWAHQILYYRGTSGNDRIYQFDLFKRWMNKFWFPAINGLQSAAIKKTVEAGHTVCLQDAIRISRAGSSATGLMSEMYGKTVKHQYEIYYGGEDRYDRQKAFCRRIADIVGYEMSED